ncbi:MAG TPA: RNA polymerase sigma factor [Candidatus Angelobacter sp.]|nr:RNA polymerase sigma factor [Candidatus Angelobacter sp.]
MADLRNTIESVFHQESGRIIAGLIRLSGSFDLAEEAMQDAFASALVYWPEKGLPENPGAWIMAAAHRKLIDYARRQRTRRDKEDSLAYETETAIVPQESISDDDRENFPDDRLRLIFTCCHPAINVEAQVALTLRTLGGLTTPEIARAFLLPEPTLAQRLVRAKRKIQEAHIPYEVPQPSKLPERLASVQAVIYLIFNEGYSATAGDSLIRRDLASEAIRLGRVLCQLMPAEAESLGLLALMLLHDSRREARTANGELVLLDEQDRSLWNRAQIEEGLRLVDQALRLRRIGPYQLQAAIAALHAQATTPEETDWKQIAALYRELSVLQPTAVVTLNHAVAVALSDGLEKGLQLIQTIGASGALDSYHLYHAARADLLRRVGRHSEAAEAYNRALSLTANAVEQRYLERRLRELSSTSMAK